jgi:putative membrane protein insertion efficiency factor
MSQTVKIFLLQLLRIYQWAVSPMLPRACRFVPTCSEYAKEAVERYGAWRGGWMALCRLLRCHPLARAGYDPVEAKSGAGHWAAAGSREERRLYHCGASAPGRN